LLAVKLVLSRLKAVMLSLGLGLAFLVLVLSFVVLLTSLSQSSI